MGLFDTIRVEIPLPDGWVPPEGTEFQSKSLDSYMDTYLLDKDGQLFKVSSFWNTGDDDEDVHIIENVPINFHGEIRFYTYEKQTSEEIKTRTYKWHEYSAIFVRGKLIDFSTIPQEVKDGGSNETNTGRSNIPSATGT